jgi:hypothetical protein
MPIRPKQPTASGSGAPPASNVSEPPLHRTPTPVSIPPTHAKRTGPNWNDDGTYNVGKYQTSPDTRWKKGQSGNPKGAKKKERPDTDTIVIGIMEEKKWLTTPQGGRRQIPAVAALYHKLYQEAIKGNLKAAQFILDHFKKARERQAGNDSTSEVLSAVEEELLQAMLQGLRPDGEGAPGR